MTQCSPATSFEYERREKMSKHDDKKAFAFYAFDRVVKLIIRFKSCVANNFGKKAPSHLSIARLSAVLTFYAHFLLHFLLSVMRAKYIKMNKIFLMHEFCVAVGKAPKVVSPCSRANIKKLSYNDGNKYFSCKA